MVSEGLSVAGDTMIVTASGLDMGVRKSKRGKEVESKCKKNEYVGMGREIILKLR